MNFTEYLALEAMNWSTLKNMAVSPRLYRRRRDHPLPDTPAMLMGRAIHSAVLEPESFPNEYRIAEPRQCAGTTKTGAQCSKPAIPGGTLCHMHGGDAEADELDELGVAILTQAQGETVGHCVESVNGHKAARELLERALQREVSIEWEIDGRRCKGRIDALGDGVLVDLKSTRSLARFGWQARDMLYHGQLAWYLDGAVAASRLDEGAEVYIVAVESVEPWDTAVIRLTGGEIEEGRCLYRRLLSDLAACEQMNYWPGAWPGTTDLETMRRRREAVAEEDW